MESFLSQIQLSRSEHQTKDKAPLFFGSNRYNDETTGNDDVDIHFGMKVWFVQDRNLPSDDDTTILVCEDDTSISGVHELDKCFEDMYADFNSTMGNSYQTNTISSTDSFSFDDTGSFLGGLKQQLSTKTLLPHDPEISESGETEMDSILSAGSVLPKMTRSVSQGVEPSNWAMAIRQQRRAHMTRSMSQSVLMHRGASSSMTRSASRKRLDAV